MVLDGIGGIGWYWMLSDGIRNYHVELNGLKWCWMVQPTTYYSY